MSRHASSSSGCAPARPSSSPSGVSTAVKQTLPVWHMDESQRRIAVFAHAGTNGVILCHLLGLEPVPVGVGSLRHRARVDHAVGVDPVG